MILERQGSTVQMGKPSLESIQDQCVDQGLIGLTSCVLNWRALETGVFGRVRIALSCMSKATITVKQDGAREIFA